MIDTARDTDLPALADMLYALNALHATHLPERFHTAGRRSDLGDILAGAMADGAQLLIYRTEGVPRGYLMWRPVDRPATALELAARKALLDHIYVQPIWRRRGLGARLMARFEQDIRAEGCTGWISRVHAFNGASAALMRGAGAQLSLQVFEKPLDVLA
ncbi:GNAT family N-acetyltransferase [Maliponia aquimaris]|uniref:Acetyltransferase (GNAT) family protein n=1 Tax=Maliponia aquimaris TaxID=1673631 RepID=A0A238KIP1_9RHOB|nr:GNAT family N-acetyltransferase [Maliponia aquimaris]SMX42590.1 Acetyltransferase (GNAT) family protein [Maliponia aquimaris]